MSPLGWEKRMVTDWEGQRLMNKESYANEGMDIKKYMLCLLKRLPVLLGAVTGGALLGLIVYTIVRTVPESEREYQAFAKIQLDFAADKTGEVYQAYNGYTWNDLMATDPIMNLTLGNLPSDYTRDEVEAALRAEILSDIRILTVTVTTNSAAHTDKILGAAVQALESYGVQAKEFIAITAIQTTQAKLVVADNRMAQAVLVGALIGLFLSLFGISFYYVMDDRILVAGDVRKVTNVSFIGYASGMETLKQDYEKNLSYLREKRGTLFICEIEKDKPIAEEVFQKMREAGGVVLSLPFGGVHGTYVSYVIEMLKTQECELCGVAIREADGKFLRGYYGWRTFGGKKDTAKA